MRRWKRIFGILTLVACGVLAVVFWPEKPEPVYKGKKLSEWMVGLGCDHVYRRNAEAAATGSVIREAVLR